MSHVIGQALFVAAVLAGGAWWVGQKPRITEAGDPVSRGREPVVLAVLVAVVFVAEVAVVLAVWPTA